MSDIIPFSHTHAPRSCLEGVKPGYVSHPYRPLHHAVTTLFEWKEIHRVVENVWTPPVMAVNDGTPRTLDETLHALEWLFLHRRAAIYVCIRQRKLRLFLPFANERFVSNAVWGLRDPTDHSKSVTDDQYQRLKQQVSGVQETVLPRQRWWCNGHLVCNVMPDNVWGDAHVAALHHMIMDTCRRYTLHDQDFILNKRDAPLLTQISVPSAIAWTPAYGPMFRVYSFYTGPGALDRSFPVPDDWFLAGHGPYPCGLYQTMLPQRRPQYRGLSKFTWNTRLPLAVFRGSSTGAGLDETTNQRIALVKLSVRYPDKIDAKITKWNTRDRMLTDTKGKVIVTCPCTKYLMHKYGSTKRMTIADQAAKYRYAIYVAGHQAASRLGELMLAGFTILYVNPRPEVIGRETWLDTDLRRLPWSSDNAPAQTHVRRSHVMPVAEDLSNLVEAIDCLNKYPEIAYRLAQNAQKLAARRINTESMIHSIQKQLCNRT